jgi:hypothetical protein
MADLNYFKDIIKTSPLGRKRSSECYDLDTHQDSYSSLDESDDAPFVIEQGQMPSGMLAAQMAMIQAQCSQMASMLKQVQGVGEDNGDIRSAVKYLEGSAVLLGHVALRNIQRRESDEADGDKTSKYSVAAIITFITLTAKIATMLWSLYSMIQSYRKQDPTTKKDVTIDKAADIVQTLHGGVESLLKILKRGTDVPAQLKA